MSADSIRDLFSVQVERTCAGSDERMAGPAALVDATQSTAA
ncbi:hypothetical protein [Amycolatopsis sp. MtRt-6]|nr:hypothetical protein [Amycolatopsis sp. MtRt-6]